MNKNINGKYVTVIILFILTLLSIAGAVMGYFNSTNYDHTYINSYTVPYGLAAVVFSAPLIVFQKRGWFGSHTKQAKVARATGVALSMTLAILVGGFILILILALWAVGSMGT